MKKGRVALIGLDGSGKSANISLMKQDAAYSDYDFIWVRWKPTLLKPLYKLIGGKAKTNAKAKTEPDENRSGLKSEYNRKAGMKKKIFKSGIVRNAWIFLATVDYFFQFYFKTLFNLLSKKGIIFDRYYLDLYVDQGINFGYSPEKIYKMIKTHQWLFPKMDKIVYIRVTPEVCYARKDDIPNMDYLEKRYAIYEYISEKDDWHVVNGNEPLEKVNGTIKSIILGGKNE